MQDSMYSALFGALTAEHRLNITANNLANVNTTGYKRDQLAFKDTMQMFAHERIHQPVVALRDKQMFPDPVYLSKVRISEDKIDFSQGSMKQTDAPLDVAIMGDGFMKVRTDMGDFYTRNGHFNMTTEGTLVTPQGFPVLGVGGEINIPPNTRVRIDETGQIFANEELAGQLQVVTVDDLTAMKKQGYNLYRLPENSDAGEVPSTATVQQGYLEAPNVNVVTEMVNMIETHRAFEAYQKITTTTQEMDKMAATRVAKGT